MHQISAYRVAGLTMLAEYIGDDAARKLCLAWGGCPVKVPKGRAGVWWQRLVETLGERDAAEFCDAFGGETIYIPRSAADEREARRQQVRRMLDAGMSYLQIARTLTFTLRYTERGLRKLMEKRSAMVARSAANPHQMSLFPQPDALRSAWQTMGPLSMGEEPVPPDIPSRAADHAAHGTS